VVHVAVPATPPRVVPLQIFDASELDITDSPEILTEALQPKFPILKGIKTKLKTTDDFKK
jgi:hypothetical protein